jgi:hypothetical protein
MDSAVGLGNHLGATDDVAPGAGPHPLIGKRVAFGENVGYVDVVGKWEGTPVAMVVTTMGPDSPDMVLARVDALTVI